MADPNVKVRITGQNDSKPAFADLESSVHRVQTALQALGFGLSIHEIATQVQKVAEHFDSLEKSAQKTGIGVEKLQELQYAAKLADLPVDALDTSMARLAKNVALAATGQGVAADAFRRMGITVTDNSGKLRSLDSIIDELGRKFATMENGTTKTAMAMELFGRGGAQMIPFLNNLSAASDEAQRLGLVMGKEVVAAGAQFNENLKTLKAELGAVKARIVGEVIPSLENYSQVLIKVAGNSEPGKFSGVAQALIAVVATADTLVVGLQMIWVRLKDIAELGKAVSDLAAHNPTTMGMYLGGDHQQNVKDYERLYDEWMNRMAALYNPQPIKLPEVQGGGGGEVDLGFSVGGADAAIAKMRQFAVEYQSLQDKTQSLINRVDDPMQRQMDMIQAQLKALREFAADNGDKILPGVNDQINALIGEQNELLAKRNRLIVEGLNSAPNPALANITGAPAAIPIAPAGADFAAEMKRIADDNTYANQQMQEAWNNTRTAAEHYRMELEKLNELHVKGLDDDTYSRALQQLQMRFNQTGVTAAEMGRIGEQAFSSDMGRALQDLTTGTKQAGAAMTNFASSFVADVARMVAEMEIAYYMQKLMGLISGALAGPSISASSIPTSGNNLAGAFAPSGGFDLGSVPLFGSGGTLVAGQPAIVGDEGPELWVPDQSGRIIPHDALAGGGRGAPQSSVQLTVVNQGSPKQAQATQPQWNDQMKQWHIQLHLDDMANNGPLSRGMAGAF